jgi:carbonic anhydrase
MCNHCHSQSPINLITSNVVLCGNSRFRLNMWDGVTTVRPGPGQHSSLKSEYPSSVMTIVDSTGKLLEYISLQYHIHSPSEHTING